MISITTLVAVDAEHLEELRLVWPTWAKNAHVNRHPLVILYDDVKDKIDPMSLLFVAEHCENATAYGIGEILPAGMADVSAGSQRERMLTALTLAPTLINTDYFMKLDTDTVALPYGQFLEDSWIENGTAIAAPRWGYTKPGHWLDTLDQWSDLTAPANSKPYREQRGGIAKSRRIISYMMVGETKFGREIADEVYSLGRMPVPSQDTFSWYCAEITGRRIVRLNHGELAWRHCGGKRKKIEALAREAMG